MSTETREVAREIVQAHQAHSVVVRAELLVDAIDKALRDERERQWRPIETCPDNTTVIFWDNGPRVGRMEHATERLNGQRQDHFWGDLFDDDNPPTRWMPLPEPPAIRRHEGVNQ